MDISEPQRYLGEVDVNALSQCILSQDANAWTEQLIRQQLSLIHISEPTRPY